MMRAPWDSIVGAGLSIALMPACTSLQSPPPGDPPPLAAAQQHQSANPAIPDAPHPVTPESSPIKPIVNKETVLEGGPNPRGGSSSELIPEPRNPAEMPPAAEVAAPKVQDPPAESPFKGTAKPAEDPPLVEAIRCFLEKRPHEAVSWLDHFDKSSQEMLLCLLPLAVRLSEQDRPQHDSRQVSAELDQLDRLEYRLRRRAPLRITKMCFCRTIQGYGDYEPRPEGYSFRPAELARIYIELQNLSDEWHGGVYSFHLLTTVKMRPFHGQMGWEHQFHDPGPDTSQSERHDFYHQCTFPIPDRPPGYYTLYVKITDVATGRTVEQTLDFRIGSRKSGG
jgi:hypothetical protein